MAKKKTRSDNGSQTQQSVSSNGDERTTTSTPTYEQIAEVAYLRYLDRGRQHGYDLDDWIDAERSLKTRA